MGRGFLSRIRNRKRPAMPGRHDGWSTHHRFFHLAGSGGAWGKGGARHFFPTIRSQASVGKGRDRARQESPSRRNRRRKGVRGPPSPTQGRPVCIGTVHRFFVTVDLRGSNAMPSSTRNRKQHRRGSGPSPAA